MKPSHARVLLTGATGGIGQATARALMRAGASLLLVGRSEGALDEMSRQLTAAGASASRVRWIAADLTQARDVQRLVIEAARLDCNVVIHGAGLPAFGAFQTLPAADIRSVLQTNLEVPVLLTQALLPRLLTLPQAQIVCVGSALGRMGLPGFSVYSASKFGLLGFAEALRRELADTTVRVQYIGPRTTRTRFNAPAVTAYNRATGTSADTPEFVANAIVQLLTDGTAERFLGFPERLAVRLNALAPAWFDRVFRKHAAHLRNSQNPTPTAPSTPLARH
ncbi:short-subunit dehydrogenase [Hydrogenophaga palleronii]|uniref:Short-subunit dehydrogenase n=1 Tax=Hydrogenophaga palleronii TaxID=65655 RepID=A0ABU1WLA4_9BURK|nr:SDR family oxidoreductase [Hydrogenophaga palleronii]MDR7149984.1 short-subunit dehydrogenase [Hydrogenophaga palleronii]